MPDDPDPDPLLPRPAAPAGPAVGDDEAPDAPATDAAPGTATPPDTATPPRTGTSHETGRPTETGMPPEDVP